MRPHAIIAGFALLPTLLAACSSGRANPAIPTVASPTDAPPTTAPPISLPTATSAPPTATAPLPCGPALSTDGILTTGIEGSYEGVRGATLQPDGKILVTGAVQDAASTDFFVVRYNPDGSLDASFGVGGIVRTQFGSFGYAKAYGIVLQPDGKIIVAGNTWNSAYDSDFALVRYDRDGSLDPTFGTGGLVRTRIRPRNGDDDLPYGYATGVVLHPDGKIVVGGYARNGPLANFDFVLLRYHVDGSLDTTFHGDGKVFTPVGNGDDILHDLALQSDGKIVAVGSSKGTDGADVIALARYDSDGSLDPTFDGDGKLTTATGRGGNEDAAFGVAIQNDDKIVVTGISSIYGPYSNRDILLARYNTDGSLDILLAGEGIVTTPVGPDDDGGWAIALQPDGKIVVAGAAVRSDEDYHEDFALVRYHADGSLDISFSGDGRVITSIGAHNNSADTVLIQPDGKILVAGGSGGDIALVRYRSDGTLDDGSCLPDA